MTEEMRRMFADVEVIGALSHEEQAARLEQMNEPELAAEVLEAISQSKGAFESFFGLRPWQYTTHQFGFIAPRTPGATSPQQIVSASTMEPDQTLVNGRINIRLSRLRVFQYPGNGIHQVLFTFKAQNQLEHMPEPISFSQTYRVQQGQLAGIAGYPIFIGLNVGANGAAFQCLTVNVKNDNDQAVLGFLDSPAFQGGLNLLTTAQPALKPLTNITLDLAHMMAKRHQNVSVQDFYLGMDFGNDALGVRLALGNYIAVQVPDEATINWQEWVFDPEIGGIVKQADRSQSMPYNYVAFAVSRYSEP